MTRVAVTLLSLAVATGCAKDPARGVAVPDPDLSGMEPQVVELLQRARAGLLAGRSAEGWGELGSVYDAHGLMAEAETCYREAARLDPDDFRWAYLLAVVREIQGAGVPEIESRFGRAATLRPDYAPIHVRLGDALSLRGEHAGARDAFERAIRLAPEAAVARRGLGLVLLALGEAEEAVGHLAQAAELEPRDLAARVGLAQALMRLGRTEEAEEMLRSSQGLQRIDAFDDPVYGAQVFMRSMGSSRVFARAQAAIRIGAYEQAVEDLAIVVRARPADASAHYWLGVAHESAGRPGPATEHLSRAVELEPKLVVARLRLGRLLLQQGRFPEAVEQYERAARLKPLDAESRRALERARSLVQ